MNHKIMLLLSPVIAALLAACSPGPDKAPAATAPATDARTPLYWYDPMVPDKHFDKPGKSPYMDMQLVPKYADEPAATGKDAPPGKPQ
jgi:hypothetical protein